MHDIPDDRGGPLPIYAIVEKASDGRRRIVCEFVSPDQARSALNLFRWAGGIGEILLISQVRPKVDLPL